jgi:hypothetical protein
LTERAHLDGGDGADEMLAQHVENLHIVGLSLQQLLNSEHCKESSTNLPPAPAKQKVSNFFCNFLPSRSIVVPYTLSFVFIIATAKEDTVKMTYVRSKGINF